MRSRQTWPARPAWPWRICGQPCRPPGDLSKVLKINIFVTDISKRDELNGVYKEYFSFNSQPPGRTMVEVKGLAIPGLMIELEATAYR